MTTSRHTNDTVRLSGYPELWKVVNNVKGSKADVQRLNDYNLQIVTVTLKSIQVVRRLGSPNIEDENSS
jgi:hypothetical protein